MIHRPRLLPALGFGLVLSAAGCERTSLHEVALEPGDHVGDKVEGRA